MRYATEAILAIGYLLVMSNFDDMDFTKPQSTPAMTRSVPIAGNLGASISPPEVRSCPIPPSASIAAVCRSRWPSTSAELEPAPSLQVLHRAGSTAVSEKSSLIVVHEDGGEARTTPGGAGTDAGFETFGGG